MRTIIKANTLAECMEAMAEYAHAYEQAGGVNVVFCEDRLTLLAERALVKATGGTFRTSVSTFARFLRAEGKTVSKQGSVMAVGEVMLDLQKQKALQCFTSAEGVGNNARCVYETLAQMSASEVTPEVLRESLSALPEDTLKRKISDLALIMEGYGDYLRERGLLDESKYLTLLPKRIREEGALKGKNVFFLAFSSFTAQAKESIRAAMETADNVVGIFCEGEGDMYTGFAFRAFQKVCEEFGKYSVHTFSAAEKAVRLPEAETLRKGLFNPVRAKEKRKTDAVRLHEARNKSEEAEYVAMKIRRELAEDSGLRYRDIAVLVSDVAAYSLPLKKAFKEYGIAYFVDEKKSLKQHPLAVFLLDCFRVVRERFSPQSVQSLAESVFFGDSDEYRNYLLKFANYRGGAKRQIKTGEAVQGYDVEKLEDCRERLLSVTKNIKARGHGRDYCAAVREICKEVNAVETLGKLCEDLNDVAQTGYLKQIDRALNALLDEAEDLTGNKEMTATEFETLLKDGLDATELSLIPLKTDAVFIGSIADSKIQHAAVMFGMGMTDDVPHSATDTAIVSDKEIKRLDAVQVLIEPTVADVNLRARESVCLNLCSFSKRLYLSYPLAADGSEPSISSIFRDIDGLFVGTDGNKLPRSKGLEEGDFPYVCSARTPAVRTLLEERENYLARRTDSKVKYSSLYEVLERQGVEEQKPLLQKQGGQVCVERGEELFFRNGRISPTALEGYFGCPFRHFAERGLRLKEREESAVLAVDTGNFIHDLLQRSTKQMSAAKDETEMRAVAAEIGEELLQKPIYTAQRDTKSGEYFTEKLLKEGVDVVAAAYRQVKNSDFVIEKTESGVSADFFYGKVDRVDGTENYVRVIDYKTGKIDDSANAYYTGQKMQMQLYMSALKGERIPAGVFYFPASVEYADEDEGRFRMKGFLNGDPDALLCGDKNLVGDKKSEYFPAALENKAVVRRVMDEQTFRDFLDYAVFAARQGVTELKDGFIAPTPYEGNCEYCKYGGMCGFDKAQDARKESTIEPKTIARIAREARDGKED